MRNRELPKHWKGWTFWENYLVDPDGNRYSPTMVKTSLFTQELAHELTGSPLQVRSLKAELKRRIARIEESPEIVIRWNGQEVSVKLPKSG